MPIININYYELKEKRIELLRLYPFFYTQKIVLFYIYFLRRSNNENVCIKKVKVERRKDN